MTAEDQLDFVAKHFRPFKNRLNTIEDTYMAVLMPSAVGKGSNHVLFRKPSTAYNQNRGLDINKDGLITVGEAADKVRSRLGAASAGTGEIMRRRSKGPEVDRLQDELVDLGYMTRAQKESAASNFGPITEEALKHFQADNHLPVNGTFDMASQDAMRQLNEGVKHGSRGNVVRGMQDRLVAIGNMTLAQVMTGSGVFGDLTDAALKSFQRNHGIEATGVLTDETYQSLMAAAPTAVPKSQLSTSTSIDVVLPDKGIGYVTYNREPGGRDQVGRASTIRSIEALGEAWEDKHPGNPLAVGDISRKGGGPFPPHATHKDGRDVDLRPLTNNGIPAPTNIGAANYSHARTRELILLVRELFEIETIFFNDPLIIKEGLSRHAKGHHNHVHVRFK
jgi:peptidoglycan hydrolase-like protein with peptidoglycan-binding domain